MVKTAKVARRVATDPTPEEIRLRAADIRRGWSQRERVRRSTWIPTAWLPPLLSMPEMTSGTIPLEDTFG